MQEALKPQGAGCFAAGRGAGGEVAGDGGKVEGVEECRAEGRADLLAGGECGAATPASRGSDAGQRDVGACRKNRPTPALTRIWVGRTSPV
ncbi:hypothetical protein GCM10023238_37000 [Streptomyces heliomycini]